MNVDRVSRIVGILILLIAADRITVGPHRTRVLRLRLVKYQGQDRGADQHGAADEIH